MPRKICTNCMNYLNCKCIHYNCAVRPDGTCKHHIINKKVEVSPDIRIEKHEAENPMSQAEMYIYHLYIDNELVCEYTDIKEVINHIECCLRGDCVW